MAGDFYKVKNIDENTIEIALSGDLNENAILPKASAFEAAKKVFVDFEKCRFLNSAGIKSWLLLMDQLSGNPDLELIFKNCRSVVLNNIAMIDGFLPSNGRLTSVYLPVYCSECDYEFEIYKTAASLVQNQFSFLKDYDAYECECEQPDSANLEIDIKEDLLLESLKEK